MHYHYLDIYYIMICIYYIQWYILYVYNVKRYKLLHLMWLIYCIMKYECGYLRNQVLAAIETNENGS